MAKQDHNFNDPIFAKEAMRRWDELRSNRTPFEQDWNDIAKLIRPQRGGFGLDNVGSRTLEKPLSSEPIMASNAMAAGLYAAITNPANRWAGLETPDEDFNKWKPMARWNDIATSRVLASFRPANSTFYSSTYQGYADVAAFGQFAHYDEIDMEQRRFIDVTMSLAEVVIDYDAHGQVCEMVRRYYMKPRAAVRYFKKRGDALPAKLIELAEKGQNDDIAFFHHVCLNDSYSVGKLGPSGKKYLSVHATEMDETTIRISGYHEMPTYYPRWDVDSGQTYATGPGFVALASARVNQQMEAATLRSAQDAADPTILAPSRRFMPLDGRIRPGSVLYGGISVRGDAMVKALNKTSQIGLTMEEKRAKMEEIKNAFYYSLMSMHNRTGLNSEEVQIMQEAQLRNWAPHSDRIMEEYAAKKVERRFAMLWRAGQIPPPPKEAQGLPLMVRYQSAATMALKAREAIAVRQFVNDLGALSQLSSSNTRAGDRFDEDAAIETLHDASPTLPASILRSREEANQISQSRAAQQEQQMQQQQLIEAAKAGGGLAKDLAAAGMTGGGQ
ncbi:portal protein [Roseobacter sp. TSBP12]|uniref:portal protein n=1 Tax=Roseobacter sp. TSBP12 TaxID=1236613 RepID=UPI00125EB530|nr:portal protein [Roseobacter sp. TSBP12]KAB6717714.1 hypothetical protein C8029_04130 [Roseobacter sp. TSBP12]